MALSGQTTVITAGTAVQLHASEQGAEVIVKALSGNLGLVYVGNDGAGDVTSANGYELSAGDAVTIFPPGRDLAQVYVDAATSGDKVCWAIVASM